MIRLSDQAVVINLAQIEAAHLERFGLEILSHEIGHHVYAPADLTDNARMIARMRWGLPTKEHLAPFIANLYTDLLINDRLQRSGGLSEAGVYTALVGASSDPLWTLYMRIYEILWSLQTGTLTHGKLTDELEGDAHLGARLIRSYARDWLDGAGKFAALCLPYLLEDDGQDMQKLLKRWRDMQNAGTGARSVPQGLSEMDPGERESAIHPALDPELSGLPRQGQDAPPKDTGVQGGSRGQYREPFEYGEILKALGIDLSPLEAAVRYYRERAAPYLVRFPERVRPELTEPLPEGLEPWDIGSPLEDADWTESVMLSPRIIPGLTTVQRVWGTAEGTQPRREPLDLDLYVDFVRLDAQPAEHGLVSHPGRRHHCSLGFAGRRAGASHVVERRAPIPEHARLRQRRAVHLASAHRLYWRQYGFSAACVARHLSAPQARRSAGAYPHHLR